MSTSFEDPKGLLRGSVFNVDCISCDHNTLEQALMVAQGRLRIYMHPTRLSKHLFFRHNWSNKMLSKEPSYSLERVPSTELPSFYTLSCKVRVTHALLRKNIENEGLNKLSLLENLHISVEEGSERAWKERSEWKDLIKDWEKLLYLLTYPPTPLDTPLPPQEPLVEELEYREPPVEEQGHAYLFRLRSFPLKVLYVFLSRHRGEVFTAAQLYRLLSIIEGRNEHPSTRKSYERIHAFADALKREGLVETRVVVRRVATSRGGSLPVRELQIIPRMNEISDNLLPKYFAQHEIEKVQYYLNKCEQFLNQSF
jgi:hypothetical protein